MNLSPESKDNNDVDVQSNQNNFQESLAKISQNFLKAQKSTPKWHFFLPLLIQISVIVAVPAKAIYTHITGKTVVLQTAPVDPYSLLKGYYQVLSYDISRPSNLSKLSGWKELKNKSCQKQNSCYKSSNSLAHGTNIYLVLTAPNKPNASFIPQAWQPVKISYIYPKNLSSSEIVLKGKYLNGTIKYGLETYYMPEKDREKVNQAIRNARENNLNAEEKIPYLVEIKVNTQGEAIPISLWISGVNYRF